MNAWFNFQTREYDYYPDHASLDWTAEQFVPYITQGGIWENVAVSLYWLLIRKGERPVCAFLHTLQAVAGERD